MIAEELLKIKSFGSDRKSAVTEGDISQKEAELGFCLPAALRELSGHPIYNAAPPEPPRPSRPGRGSFFPLPRCCSFSAILPESRAGGQRRKA